MEEEHLIGRRLVIAAATIAKQLGDNQPPPLRAMGLLVYLLLEFIDRYHHAVEERVLLPLAFAFGYPPATPPMCSTITRWGGAISMRSTPR